MTRDEAEQRWGPDPQAWPAWNCSQCPERQRSAGWALICGRCGAARDAGWGAVTYTLRITDDLVEDLWNAVSRADIRRLLTRTRFTRMGHDKRLP